MPIDQASSRGQERNNGKAARANEAAYIDKQVGEAIRRRRTALGLKQDQIAVALEISYQQIQKYEAGSNRVSAGRLAQIAYELRVPISHFFDNLTFGDPNASVPKQKGLSNHFSTPPLNTALWLEALGKIKNPEVETALFNLTTALTRDIKD
jgi:transcriptional regulator with XRE-family HTH domain